jgi:hypothetical protein
MKRIIALLPVLILAVGCMAPRVPQTVLETPLGQFKGPKDMELEIEGLEFIRDTNGVTMLTAKVIRSKTRNNPAAINASSEQMETNWKGFKDVAGEITERVIKGAKTP